MKPCSGTPVALLIRLKLCDSCDTSDARLSTRGSRAVAAAGDPAGAADDAAGAALDGACAAGAADDGACAAGEAAGAGPAGVCAAPAPGALGFELLNPARQLLDTLQALLELASQLLDARVGALRLRARAAWRDCANA